MVYMACGMCQSGLCMSALKGSQVEGGVDAFAKEIDEWVAKFYDRREEGLTLSEVRIRSLLSRVLELCRVHGVEMNPPMARIVLWFWKAWVGPWNRARI